jgi:hypothetical protein
MGEGCVFISIRFGVRQQSQQLLLETGHCSTTLPPLLWSGLCCQFVFCLPLATSPGVTRGMPRESQFWLLRCQALIGAAQCHLDEELSRARLAPWSHGERSADHVGGCSAVVLKGRHAASAGRCAWKEVAVATVVASSSCAHQQLPVDSLVVFLLLLPAVRYNNQRSLHNDALPRMEVGTAG